GSGLYVSAVAAGIQDSFVGSVWQNRRRIRESDSQFCGQRKDSSGAFQERGEQRSESRALYGSGGTRRQGPGGADRNRSGESIGMAILADKRTGKAGASSHGMGAANGIRESFLLLYLGYRLGCR